MVIKFIKHKLKKAFPRWFIPNGLLSYNDLCVLVELGIIATEKSNTIDGNVPAKVPENHINGTSIDVTLDKFICVENLSGGMDKVNLAKGETIKLTEPFELHEKGYMMPDTIMLASTKETLNLPSYITAEFRLKSTLARNGLDHALAVWCDPYFSGKVTLELKNNTQFHKLILTEGMKIGQIVFFKHHSVPFDSGYKKRGQYNDQNKVTPSKPLR